MKKLFFILTIVVIFALVMGAVFFRQTSSSPVKEEKKVSVQKSDYDLVAVRINGKDLRKGDILRNGKVILQLNLNKARKRNIRKREVRALEKYCRAAVSREIAKSAVERYMEECNIHVSTGVLDRVMRRFVSQYGVRSKKLKRHHTIDDLKSMLGKNAFRIDEMILETARFETMTNDVIKKAHLDVSNAEVEERVFSIRKGNEKVAKVAHGVFEKATNVWKKIVSQEMTFEAAALKFSEDEYIKEGCEWGTFSREQLEDEKAVLALLPSLKTGELTPPIESDGGLAILRKDEDANPQNYTFSRIFFRLPYSYEEETPEQARRYLRERKGAALIKSTFDEYISKLKIEYPDGTNILWKITKQDFK